MIKEYCWPTLGERLVSSTVARFTIQNYRSLIVEKSKHTHTQTHTDIHVFFKHLGLCFFLP